MRSVEIDFIVEDSLAALALYEEIFDVKRIEATSFDKGQNEAVFEIYGTRFHMLDANADAGLPAPNPEENLPIWFNVTVEDIARTYKRALDAGCTEIQAVTEMKDYGVSNAMFKDAFGYIWMLHQVHREISFEEREAMHRKNME
ncbi:VOC family protein [Listeria aquatica]|uniref:VOC family protein n=1 Tax=Listeria aquatica TaxID=1494960 RepID=A0A841ZSB6_9LIST|nr:VOC family protein [Listeria aquatica]MBC1522302.1 VOC family protein [Listeria aquatica]